MIVTSFGVLPGSFVWKEIWNVGWFWWYVPCQSAIDQLMKQHMPKKEKERRRGFFWWGRSSEAAAPATTSSMTTTTVSLSECCVRVNRKVLVCVASPLCYCFLHRHFTFLPLILNEKPKFIWRTRKRQQRNAPTMIRPKQESLRRRSRASTGKLLNVISFGASSCSFDLIFEPLDHIRVW